MSSEKSSTKQSSNDDYFISLVDDNNGQLILDLINLNLQKSYLDSSYSCSFWRTEEIYVITNEKLEMSYRNKSEELKASYEGLFPMTLFSCYRTQNCLSDIAVNGLRTKLTGFNILGDNSKGVTLCQHADIQLKAAEVKPSRCFLFLFACTCSRIARIDCCDQGKNNCCPISSYDCHISSVRPNVNDGLLTQAVRAQIYFYDVNEKGSYFSHPRQCLPLACIVYAQSESSEKTASVPVKHIEVGQPRAPAEAVIDLTGPDETIPLLDKARGASLYNRLRRHFRKTTSAEEIYCLSNYFPNPINELDLSVAASSLSELSASWHRVAQSSLRPTTADTVAAFASTNAGTVQERATIVTCQANPVYSLREKMSQFCVSKNQKSPSNVPNAVARAVGIAMAANAAPLVGGTTLSPNVVPSWARGHAVAATVSWPTFAPNVQVTVTNAMPRVGNATVWARTWAPKVVGTTPQSLSSLLNTSAQETTVGQVPQCPRMVRYLPRILRPPTGLSSVRMLSNSNATTAAVAPPVITSRLTPGAVPAFLVSSIVPLVTRPQSVAMMASMPSLFSGGNNIRSTTTSSGNIVATELMSQWQSILPQRPLQTFVPLYAGHSQLNFAAQPANCDPQAQLIQTAASQVVSSAGKSINAAEAVNSQPPFLFQVPSSMAQFTATRSADQQRGSSAAAPERNLFFEGNEVEEITIEDEGLIISGVRPIVIMPDGTCDEEEEQNSSLAGAMQGNTETKAIDCNRVSDCGKGILKTEENNQMKSQKNHTIILDADLPMNEGEAYSEDSTLLTVHDRLMGQEMDEDGDLLDRQLRISDVVSLQTRCDSDNSSMVHSRLLDELWMENGKQLDNVRPAESSLLSTNCEMISLASVAVKNTSQVSTESLSLECTEAPVSFSETPLLSPVADSLMHPKAVTSADLVASSSQMQDDARTSEEAGEKTAEKELTASAGSPNIGCCGSQEQQKISLEKSMSEEEKHPSCGFSKLPMSGNHMQKRQQSSTMMCLPMSEQSTKAAKGKSAKQGQTIPVFTVGADGTVGIRLDTETEANEDTQNARQYDVRIELLKDVYKKDSLMKALAEVLGNIHVTDMRNSSNEIVYCSQNKKAEKIATSSLNMQRSNVVEVDGVEQSTGLKKDSAVSHKPASGNNASDTNLLIESVCSIDPEKFDEISKSSGKAKDPLQSKGVTSGNDEEEVGRLDDTVARTSRANDVESMNISDIEENDVENEEAIQHREAETEKFSLSASNTNQGFQQQCDFSQVPCSSDSSNAKQKHLVSGNEILGISQESPSDSADESDSCRTCEERHLHMSCEPETCGIHEEKHLHSVNESEVRRTSNEQQPLHLEKESQSSRIHEEKLINFTSESETRRVHEERQSSFGLVSESETCAINEQQPLGSANESDTCGINEEQLSDMAIEPVTCRIIEEQHLDLTSESKSCRIHEEQQPLGLAKESAAHGVHEEHQSSFGLVIESETCGINEQQPLGSANESDTCRINEEQLSDMATEPGTCRIIEEQHLNSTNASKSCRTHEEHLDLTNESETHGVHEEQQLSFGLVSDSETCGINEKQPLGSPNESDTCRINEERHLYSTSDSKSCRMHEEQHLDLANESETCGVHEEQQPSFGLVSDSGTCGIYEQQPLGLANESDTCRINEERHLDSTSESQSCGMHEEQHLCLASESETCKIHGNQLADLAIELETYTISSDQPPDSANESETYRINEEQLFDLAEDSEICGINESKHLDLANESKILGINTKLPLEMANETCRISKQQLLNSEDESAITRTFQESPLTLAIELGDSRVNEKLLMPKAVNSLNSNIENCETLCFGSPKSVSSAYVTEAISPISPAYVTEAISPAYVTEPISPVYEAISPAYVTEPISPAYVTEPISPPACGYDEPVSPDSTCRLLRDVTPCYPQYASVALIVTSLCETDSVPKLSGFLCSSAHLQSGSETEFNSQYTPQSDSNTSNAGVAINNLKGGNSTTGLSTSFTDDDPAVQDVFDCENRYLLEPVKKSLKSDSETSSQTSRARETKAGTQKKKKFSLEEYKQNKLKGPTTKVQSTSNLSALETQVQNLNLNPSSHHLDKEQFLGVKGSCHSESVTFTLTGTEKRPDDQLKNVNSEVNVNLMLSEKVTENTDSAVIKSVNLRDPRLQCRSSAFKNFEVMWKNAPSEVEKEKDFKEARVEMMAQEQLIDLNEDVVHEKTQQQLVSCLETEEEERSSQKMDELINDAAMEGMNVMARDRKDEQEIELIEGDKEQENALEWGCKVIDHVNKDEEIQEIGSDGKEPGEIEDEIFGSEAQENVEQVVSEQLIEVLDDWDEYGDLVIVGNGLDVLSDDDKESGELTSESSDEFGDFVVNDGSDEDEYACNQQLQQSVDGETDQEHVWHLLDNALTVSSKCESEDQTQTTVKQQLKADNIQVQKKSPIIIKLKSEAAKRLAKGEKTPAKDVSQENTGTGLKENSEGTVVVEKYQPHRNHYRKRKCASKKGRRSGRTTRKNTAGDCEFPSAEHLNISEEKHENQKTSEDQSLSYQWDLSQSYVRKTSEDKGSLPIDIEIIKVLRNVDDISAGRSVFGSADSFVTLLMKEFQHLPEESQHHYNECIRQLLLVDEEFVTSEHIYGSMAELLTEEQRQHIQQTNISPVVARELHLEDILKKVKLELAEIQLESSRDQTHHNLLILTKEMLYDQMNDLKCYHKSRSVFVLPDEFRLPREYGKYISVDGSLLFLSKCTISVKKCCKLYCYRTEIEEMEDELNESLCDAGASTEEICRKLSVLYLKRRHCLQDIGCTADQLHELNKKFSKNLSWFRRMRDILESKGHSKDGQKMALVNSLNQRTEKLKEYIKVITRLKNVSGIWCPDK